MTQRKKSSKLNIQQSARITDLAFDELAALIEARGAKPYRARQIFEWVYLKQAASFDKMTNLPAALRHALAEEFVVRGTKVVEAAESHETKTTKCLIRLDDGETVETVERRLEVLETARGRGPAPPVGRAGPSARRTVTTVGSSAKLKRS